MKQQKIINRREFITGVSAAGAFSLLPLIKTHAIEQASVKKGNYYKSLIDALKERSPYHGGPLIKGQLKNLFYALEQIKPSNHQEKAFVVACGTTPWPYNHIVDEYVRRRKGEKPLLPDHSMLELKTLSIPSTHRILIFKEQFVGLLTELTGRKSIDVIEMYYAILNNSLSYEEFIKAVNKKGNQLSSEESKVIFTALYEYSKVKPPYIWCSTIVNKADNLLNAQAY